MSLKKVNTGGVALWSPNIARTDGVTGPLFSYSLLILFHVTRAWPVTNLHRRDGEALDWTKGVGPHPVDGSGGVDEDRVPVATLLAPVQDPERLVDGENLRTEHLFVCLPPPHSRCVSGRSTPCPVVATTR